MSRVRWPALLALLAAGVLLWVTHRWLSQDGSVGSILALAMAFFFPTALLLIAWSALPAERAAGLGSLALSLAVVGYLVCGFGLHFGGVAAISRLPGLQPLSRYFSLVSGSDSGHWGIAGLTGFFLSGDTATPAVIELFLAQLPLIASGVLIVMLALPRGTPALARLVVGLVAATLTFPLAGNWVTGGGWLANLGHTLSMGQGLVDFGGLGSLVLVGGASALSASLLFGRRSRPSGHSKGRSVLSSGLPAAHNPMLAATGALLAVTGWIALALANPLLADLGATLNWPSILLNGLAGLAAGTIPAQLFGWFTSGRFDPLMGPRGALAGLIAVSPAAPFIPLWAAVLVGGVAGLVLSFAIYVVEHLFRLEDTTAAIAGYGLPSLWGLLSVALFADGRWGQGWNGVAGPFGQGVTGLLPARGLQADPGQLSAQVWGSVVLLAWGFLLPWGALKLVTAVLSLQRPRRSAAPDGESGHSSPLTPTAERQSASPGFDGIVNVDERG
jgi:Amt family ammonium transporter